MDGKHFATRRVVAIQHGQQIFNMSASFQLAEAGLDHQFPMPEVPPPESLADLESVSPHGLELPARRAPRAGTEASLRIPPGAGARSAQPGEAEPPSGTSGSAPSTSLPDDEALHRCLLAYVSDFHLLDTALMPHGVSWSRKLVIASIDHAMWFHRSVAWMIGSCMRSTARVPRVRAASRAAACLHATVAWWRAPRKKA